MVSNAYAILLKLTIITLLSGLYFDLHWLAWQGAQPNVLRLFLRYSVEIVLTCRRGWIYNHGFKRLRHLIKINNHNLALWLVF